MNSENTKEILRLAAKYVDGIMSNDFEDLIGKVKAKSKTDQRNTPLCDNPENIESGIAGMLMFLSELYSQTKNQIYLRRCEELAGSLVSFCETHATNNYSLYTGRAGVAYCLMKLFEINGDQRMLDQSLEILKPSNLFFLKSKYTSDSLYDGRAGTLLTIVNLYLATKKTDLLEYIEKFTNEIISNALLSSKGISWRRACEINLKNSCGFAYGTAGIRYSLSSLNKIGSSENLSFIISEADRYTQSCWNDEVHNWGCFEKDILTTEKFSLLKKLYLNEAPWLYMPTYEIGWGSGFAGIANSLALENGKRQTIHSRHFPFDSQIYDLKNGLSGAGLCFIEYFKESKNNEFLTSLEFVKRKIIEEAEVSVPDISLMTGRLGSIYFLLRTLKESAIAGSVLTPFATSSSDCSSNGSVSLKIEKEKLFSRTFGRSLAIAAAIDDHALSTFMGGLKSGNDSIDKLRIFIEEAINRNSTNDLIHPLKDVFNLEKQKLDVDSGEKRTNIQIYFDELFHRVKVIELLNNEDEWLLSQSLVLASNVKLVNTEWDWSSDKNSAPLDVANSRGQRSETLLMPKFDDTVAERSLKVDGLVVKRFEQPKTVKQALKEITLFCQSQYPYVLEELSKSSGSVGIADFIDRLPFLVLHKVKELLYESVLIFD
jgi:hypothetical protein